MADEQPRDEPPVSPVGEQIHLPGPSHLPVIVAFGITLALVGIVLSWALFAIGVVIFAIPLARWIKETREDISELPLEHRHH